MRKKILIFIASLILLVFISSISAGVLKYFGVITAEIKINAPEVGVNVPAIEEDCKNNKWENLVTLGNRPFRNYGDCISYIETNMCEDFELFEEYPENFSSFGSCNSYFSSNKIKKDNEIKGLEERINNETPGDNETKKPLNNSENTTTINITNSSSENQTIEENNSEYNKTMEINLNETIEEPNNTNDELNDSSTNEDREETNSTETNENTEETSDNTNSENNETEELNNETDS